MWPSLKKTFNSTGLDISVAQAALNATSLGALTASVDLSISGAATLNVLSGLVVLKVAGFDMQLGQVSGSDGTTTLTDARAMTVTLTDVTLWVGPGGSLADGGTPTFSDDTVQAGDLGFSGHVDSMKLASLKDLRNPAVTTDDVSYLALDISGLNASLVGLEDVLVFNAWDIGVLLNSASDSDGNATTTPKKLDWANFAVSDGDGCDQHGVASQAMRTSGKPSLASSRRNARQWRAFLTGPSAMTLYNRKV